MKKTLAILLALIMTASVALMSCDNSADNIEDDEDFVIDDFGGDEADDKAPETNDKGETVKPNTDKNTTNTNNGTTMVDVNDKVYVLYNAKIRNQASTKSTSNVIGTAPFGAELTRTQKTSDDKWSKVTYTDAAGKKIEGYISNELVTTNKQTVTFVKQEKVTGEGEDKKTEAVVSKLVLDSKVNNYRLRYFPLADGYPHKVSLELGEIGQIKPGTEVTVLEVSEDKMWAKISSTAVDKAVNGDYTGNYTSTAEGYVPYSFLEIGASNNNNNQSGGNGPLAG